MEHPLNERIENAEQKQCAKYGLVVPGDPGRKIDVEIIPSVLGEARCDSGQWATATIYRDDQDFESYHPD